MNYIDEKVTVWNRIKFDDNADMQAIIEIIKSKGLMSAIDEGLGFLDCEILHDSEETIEPNKNGGCSTIEVFQDKQLIWQNGSETGG